MIINMTGGGGSSKPATMSFSSCYGTAPDAVTARFVEPAEPSQDGYVFGGWYTDEACTSAYEWTSAAANGTLYAKWSIAAPTVSPASDWTYDGSAHALGTVTALGSGQAVEYSVDGGDYTTTAPTATDAGSYSVAWRVSADYCETLTGSWTVEVGKASCGLSVSPTELEVEEDGTGAIEVTRTGDGAISAESSDTSVATVAVDGTTVTVTYVDAGDVTVTVAVAEAANYEGGGAACAVTCGSSLNIVTWADGTDEEIAAMVAAADAGEIDLTDYWGEGDTRTVSLSAMSATGVGESHSAQTVQMVLTSPGHYTLASATAGGRTTCSFVVLQKNCLATAGYMNSSNTNSGGWGSCARRTWCNSVYRNAVPSGLRGIFKQFKNTCASGSGSSTTTSTDYFTLASEKEVFGSVGFANSTAESSNSQLTWYETSANRVKTYGTGGSSAYWWERSPRSGNSGYFCRVDSGGGADYYYASTAYGLAPLGCI